LRDAPGRSNRSSRICRSDAKCVRLGEPVSSNLPHRMIFQPL
jgi:hypothetical protein